MRPHWTPGNSFELLENGEEFFPRVFDTIRQAEREVLLETFILFDDPIGQQLRAALLETARRGVAVNVLVDGWGTPDLDQEFLRPLLDAGVQWRVFNPAMRWFGFRVNPLRRMHRKLVVVDGQIAFIGGLNYSYDHVAEFGPEAKQDYAVMLQGPVVEQVHAFCRHQHSRHAEKRQGTRWSRWRQRMSARRAMASAGAKARASASASASANANADASATSGTNAKADADTAPSGWAALVVRDNGLHRSDIERQYRLALRSAKKHVLIANAYFFPGYRLLRDLRRAAKRGVRVELVLQGDPDMPIAQNAAALLYASLTQGGVHIYEYCERPLHGKVAVVDDEWATVGSSNLDPTSLGLNLEANVLIRDRAFATGLHQRLQELIDDRCHLVAQDASALAHPWWARLKSTALYHVLRWWPQVIHALPQQQAATQPLRKPT